MQVLGDMREEDLSSSGGMPSALGALPEGSFLMMFWSSVGDGGSILKKLSGIPFSTNCWRFSDGGGGGLLRTLV